MNKTLKQIGAVWPLSIIRRVVYASSYYNKKYFQIVKWAMRSKEDTNFTYDLTRDNLLSLAQTIAVVTKYDAHIILEYIEEAQNDVLLKESIRYTIKKSLKGKTNRTDAEVKFGRRLGWYALVRILKPGIVVETGVDKGLGSVLLCTALQRNSEEGFRGKYFGTDINPEAGFLLTEKYSDVGKILYGDSIESLNKLDENIDLFINDSDHSGEYEYREYLAISDKLSENAIILGDNSHCSNKLSRFSDETGRSYLYFQEQPLNHWYPGCGIGISFIDKSDASKYTIVKGRQAVSAAV